MSNQLSGAEPDASAPFSALLVSADGARINRIREFLTGGPGGVGLENAESLHAARERLSTGGIAPSDLELEITESALMRDEQVAERTFSALKRIGVGVSLDDFGTGYSTLSYLKRFPVDTVKIDRSFIRDLVIDPDDSAIVSAILAIARQLALNVVAEGVETEEQRVFLTERMCPQLQGFLLSQPLTAEDVGALLRNGPRAAQGLS